MRAINVFLALLVSAVLALVVAEIGLRLLGLGPVATINHFDPELGWSKQPSTVGERKTREFDVRFEINQLGLRDDPMSSPAKPGGTFRVVMLGDSFVQGYTVQRDDLFVDQLERWWKAEGRAVDVVNAGTEAYSTDQEVRWLELNGKAFAPDLVLLFPYENDLFWNARRSYQRFPKPRYHPEGRIEPRVLEDPGPKSWTESWAVTKFLAAFGGEGPPRWQHPSGQFLFSEHAAYFAEPPEFMHESYARTRGALIALKRTCAELGCELVVVPIPNKACIEPAAQASLAAGFEPNIVQRSLRDVKDIDPSTWSADRPVETFLSTCAELGIATLDPRPALRAATEQDPHLYYKQDWHFDPAGNRAFAGFLHDALDQQGAFPPLYAKTRTAPPPAGSAEGGGLPGWVPVFAILWAALGLLYALTYREEKVLPALLKVGGMLALIFAIVLGGGRLVELLPPKLAKLAALAFVLGILVFVLYKLGRRLGTITELFGCFVRRGHWYLMPLVVVLLTIGSLLVVAASSPLVAPFIYTLF